jgi:hypothetical protein
VLGTNFLISFIIPFAYHGVTITLALGAPILFMALMKPRFCLRPMPTLVFWVPFLSHIYLLIAGLVSGVILQPPFLLAMGLVMLGAALFLHRPTIQGIFARKTG